MTTATIDAEYEAVVFDNDGVLIELTDRDLLARTVHDVFESFDVSAAESFVRETVRRDAALIDRLQEEYDLDPAEFWERRERAVVAAQCDAIECGEKALYDDALAITELTQDLAVVSNNQRETIEFIVEHHGLEEHFEVALGREPTLDGLDRKKPNPHYLERALSELGTREALYVGDSEKDVIAARRAGVDAAFLRREHRADLSLSATPDYEFPDLRSLVDALVADPAATTASEE